MQVLLLQDVYKLGRAGQIKKVANGYGRNFLIPQGLAASATKVAVQQAERIAAEADKRRTTLNTEMGTVAKGFEGLQLFFPARAGETGKLYGSVTTQDIADQLNEKLNLKLDKRQIHSQPLRLLGMHKGAVRLTLDIIPEFEMVVYREGESPENYMVAAETLAASAEGAQVRPIDIAAPAASAESTEEVEMPVSEETAEGN
jgi:large subunit ribosomal protein L9